MNEIPCHCGHDIAEHPKVGNRAGDPNDYLVCNMCFKRNRIRGIKQLNTKDCWEYIPDNLNYIEKLAKERKLI
jgi:hypothetical protein